MVPYKSHVFRVILDLFFSLKIFGMEVLSVNETNVATAPMDSMNPATTHPLQTI